MVSQEIVGRASCGAGAMKKREGWMRTALGSRHQQCAGKRYAPVATTHLFSRVRKRLRSCAAHGHLRIDAKQIPRTGEVVTADRAGEPKGASVRCNLKTQWRRVKRHIPQRDIQPTEGTRRDRALESGSVCHEIKLDSQVTALPGGDARAAQIAYATEYSDLVAS